MTEHYIIKPRMCLMGSFSSSISVEVRVMFDFVVVLQSTSTGFPHLSELSDGILMRIKNGDVNALMQAMPIKYRNAVREDWSNHREASVRLVPRAPGV